jgi:hypothetical protein
MKEHMVQFTNRYGNRDEVPARLLVLDKDTLKVLAEIAKLRGKLADGDATARAIQAKAAGGGDTGKLTTELIATRTEQELVSARINRLADEVTSGLRAVVVKAHAASEAEIVELRKERREVVARAKLTAGALFGGRGKVSCAVAAAGPIRPIREVDVQIEAALRTAGSMGMLASYLGAEGFPCHAQPMDGRPLVSGWPTSVDYKAHVRDTVRQLTDSAM